MLSSNNSNFTKLGMTSSVSIEPDDQKIQEVWSKYTFDTEKSKLEIVGTTNHNIKTTWSINSGDGHDEIDKKLQMPAKQSKDDEIKTPTRYFPQESSQNVYASDHLSPEKEEDTSETSPSYYARRPPNAFLIFCKKHRAIVREKYPTTENRGVTKVLGEWWATLEISEKKPYNDLAKNYKEAFLSANPDFRWYKLPAPPLRTLSTRPSTVTKPATPVSSPPQILMSEFNPGKLADETQLGGLTSLMTNNNYSPTSKASLSEMSCCKNIENNNNTTDYQQSSFTDQIKESPTKLTNKYFDIYAGDTSSAQSDLTGDSDSQQRKSDRMCKGKRYEQFMLEGKLLGNKPFTKLAQYHKFESDIRTEQEFSLTSLQTSPEPPKFLQISSEPPKLDLENTIKRLAERTNVKLDFGGEEFKINRPERMRTVSETSESEKNMIKNAKNLSAQLDVQIGNLPQMNYDEFVARKREGKKRKIKIKLDTEPKIKTQKIENQLVGSQKRKNKQNIIHLNTDNDSNLKINGNLVPNNNKFTFAPTKFTHKGGEVQKYTSNTNLTHSKPIDVGKYTSNLNSGANIHDNFSNVEKYVENNASDVGRYLSTISEKDNIGKFTSNLESLANIISSNACDTGEYLSSVNDSGNDGKYSSNLTPVANIVENTSSEVRGYLSAVSDNDNGVNGNEGSSGNNGALLQDGDNALLGLDVLALVAASTEKLNEGIL